jgi:hypothetical protein
MIDDCREGVKRNFELAQGKAAELGTLPEMMSSAAFADFGPDRRAMVRTAASGLSLLTRLSPCRRRCGRLQQHALPQTADFVALQVLFTAHLAALLLEHSWRAREAFRLDRFVALRRSWRPGALPTPIPAQRHPFRCAMSFCRACSRTARAMQRSPTFILLRQMRTPALTSPGVAMQRACAACASSGSRRRWCCRVGCGGGSPAAPWLQPWWPLAGALRRCGRCRPRGAAARCVQRSCANGQQLSPCRYDMFTSTWRKSQFGCDQGYRLGCVARRAALQVWAACLAAV